MEKRRKLHAAVEPLPLEEATAKRTCHMHCMTGAQIQKCTLRCLLHAAATGQINCTK